MQALTFWKTVTVDHTGLLERLIALLRERDIRFCVIGGQAVNAYVEPLVSLDLDIVIATEQIDDATTLLSKMFRLERFPHTLNISLAGSDLRAQIHMDPRYNEFVARAAPRQVLGLVLPVASLDDVLHSKVWAIQDTSRRASKRQKDLADIARLLEAYPLLRAQVPNDVLARLV